MIYLLHFFTLLFVLILDLGLVATLDKYVGNWEVYGVLGYIVKMAAGPFYLLIVGSQQISNCLLGTKYEL